MTNRQLVIALLLVAVALTGCVLFFGPLELPVLGIPFALLAVGVGAWTVAALGTDDYVALSLMLIILAMGLVGLVWLVGRVL